VSEATLAALAELAALNRSALAERWEEAFGVPAPKSCQATLLRQALAWQLQMQALEASVGVREARRAAQSLRQAASSSPVSALSPGTRLLREWQGRTHHVCVVPGGFEYEGQVWRSLSAIARSITGTPWSGPKFFGLIP
jgi:Protein of unknown function (DUF2924)